MTTRKDVKFTHIAMYWGVLLNYGTNGKFSKQHKWVVLSNTPDTFVLNQLEDIEISEKETLIFGTKNLVSATPGNIYKLSGVSGAFYTVEWGWIRYTSITLELYPEGQQLLESHVDVKIERPDEKNLPECIKWLKHTSIYVNDAGLFKLVPRGLLLSLLFQSTITE